MPVAVQALPYLAALAAVAILAGWLGGTWAAAPFLAAAGFVLYFFRDPQRVSPEGEGLVVSPADGRVTDVERRPEGARISIFLSLFNCHINRAPVAATIVSVTHTPGLFRAAWDRRAATENERNHLQLRAADGEYGVTQIAGILARRIVCSKRAGDAVGRGERIGLIQFGSRTDLHLPPGVEPAVEVGDRVRGAVTVLARRVRAARVAS
ncbi:MAG TPA: phosphatidylserine decarboxylase [Candidatus Polarisedimenticolia bacterium]|nr:phosphatidylserine decarboxylase [Candidatus Polarisedimenticolia bacterium]